METKTVRFCIGSDVRKRIDSPLQLKHQNTTTPLNLPLMKTRVLHAPMAFSNAMVSTCDQGFWMDVLLGYTFFHLISPVTRTAWALGRCATACASKHVISARWCTTSFYSYISRSSGSKLWVNVDRSWWPDCLAYSSPDLTTLDFFLWGHMKSLV